MKKKQNKESEHMDRRIWDLVIKEEKKLEKGYAEWTDIEKLSFVLENRLPNLFFDTLNVIKKINDTVSDAKNKHREDVTGRREEDIHNLESYGFLTVLETPERFTSYKPYGSEGMDFIKRHQFYYKQTYFVHPEKSIYLAMEHFFERYAFDYLGDVSGYMIVKKDDEVLRDISRHVFWDWTVDVLDSNKFGINLYRDNFNKALSYLEQGKIVDFQEPMSPLHLLLNTEQQRSLSFPFSSNEEKLKVCNEIVKSMDSLPNNYFDLAHVKQYTKYRDL